MATITTQYESYINKNKTAIKKYSKHLNVYKSRDVQSINNLVTSVIAVAYDIAAGTFTSDVAGAVSAFVNSSVFVGLLDIAGTQYDLLEEALKSKTLEDIENEIASIKVQLSIPTTNSKMLCFC